MRELQEALGYSFKDPELLRRALTHKSLVHDKMIADTECNERLEFLGDAVLELVVSEHFYTQYESMPEGEMTRGRANWVCESTFAALAENLQLKYIISVGYSEAASGGRGRVSILADAYEAVIGAVYIDGGFDAARVAVHNTLMNFMRDRADDFTVADPKSRLQEHIQKNSRVPAVYSVLEETGPPHNKCFTVSVSHENRLLGKGSGKSKKEAEQHAAFEALALFD
ncbi:MAG: ribonuclease III [Defluviitaleaceae bacterium]|nr:ribonuclease III [Defluviitaleaceae bacterium]